MPVIQKETSDAAFELEAEASINNQSIKIQHVLLLHDMDEADIKYSNSKNDEKNRVLESRSPSMDITDRSLSTVDDTEAICLDDNEISFAEIRGKYLLVMLAVMLADGLQGTHLYVLYESYGFSVASLYSLGFVAGAVSTPITGPLIDTFGRKWSALLYCALEIGINLLEQFPFLVGLMASRMIGGITTNLLSTVFETWLDTEYRRQGLKKEKYEVILRDAVVVSNLAAIVSGYLSHVLAERLGPVGPFQGAVSCTAVAFFVILMLWNENYGTSSSGDHNNIWTTSNLSVDQHLPKTLESQRTAKSFCEYISDALKIFRSDTKALRVGIIQGLTVGSLQIFVFLWSPTLQQFSKSAKAGCIGLDSNGDPAYGLIFGSYMAAGVCGGLLSPTLRELCSRLFISSISENKKKKTLPTRIEAIIGEQDKLTEDDCPKAVEFLTSICYFICFVLLLVPTCLESSNPRSFMISLTAFLLYEFVIGVMSPCEGLIRSLYMPSDARATMMTLPRMIVNLAVSLGVILTEKITTQATFGAIAGLMSIACILQLSLVRTSEWHSLRTRLYRNIILPVGWQNLSTLYRADRDQQNSHFAKWLMRMKSKSSLIFFKKDCTKKKSFYDLTLRESEKNEKIE